MNVITNVTTAVAVSVMIKVNTNVIVVTSPVDNEFESNFKETYTQLTVNLISD